MHERFRNEHEDALRATCEQQPMENQTGFDGFAQPDFIRQHHAGRVPSGDFMGDVKLVRNQVNAPAHETTHGGLARTVQPREGAPPEIKRREVVKSSGEQTLLRSVQTKLLAQLCFGQLPVAIENTPATRSSRSPRGRSIPHRPGPFTMSPTRKRTRRSGALSAA